MILAALSSNLEEDKISPSGPLPDGLLRISEAPGNTACLKVIIYHQSMLSVSLKYSPAAAAAICKYCIAAESEAVGYTVVIPLLRAR